MDEKPGGRMTLRFFLGWSSAYRSFADVHNDYFYTYRQPLVVVRRNTPAIVLDRKRLEEPGKAQPVVYAARVLTQHGTLWTYESNLQAERALL